MDALGLGLALGLAASISPGPLLVLVVTSALRSGWRAGSLTACAPLLSDAVVVAVTLLLLDRLPGRALGVLGVVGAVFVVWTGVQTVRDARSASLTDRPPTPGDRASRQTPEPLASPATPADQASPAPPEDHASPPLEDHASQGSPPRGSLNSILPPGSDNSGSAEVAVLRRAVVVNLLSPHPWIAWATALGPLTVTTWRASAGAGVGLLVGFYLTLVGGKVVIALLVARGRRRLNDTGYRRALTAAGALLVLAGVAMGVEFATLWSS
ncbi:LysE family transporter [Saccharothrix texasensis]|uniref:LysE type translocator n=1 Tax=Saccharothrix texasensis TaxID=103734 RepID=A0A3N1H188_9PSEU|nr:LysE family transporter [Saccharothrix texasensis]ROP36239.1 LysE type translocator [Saccharothrix texasensis]